MKAGNKNMRMEVIHGSKTYRGDEAKVFLIGSSERFHARRLQARLERTKKRLAHSPERQSVAIAMLAVEEQIVKALWTIARQPLGKVAPMSAKRNGLDYMHERERGDTGGYRDAAGGDWSSIAPRPALPSAKDITQADRVQDWLLLIDDEDLRKLLVVGATSKRGDAGRQINWRRIIGSLPQLGGLSLNELNKRYSEALRIIVSELTTARVG